MVIVAFPLQVWMGLLLFNNNRDNGHHGMQMATLPFRTSWA